METSWKTHTQQTWYNELHDKRYYTLKQLVGKERRGLGILDNRRKKETQILCKSAMYKPVILCSYRISLMLALIIAHCEPATSSLLMFS